MRGPQAKTPGDNGKRPSEARAEPIPDTDQSKKNKTIAERKGIQGVKPLVILFPPSFSYARDGAPARWNIVWGKEERRSE